MSRDHSLNLNKLQTQLIQATANAIQPCWRQQFLAGIADRLEGVSGPVTNADVIAAIDNVRAALAGDDDYSDCC